MNEEKEKEKRKQELLKKVTKELKDFLESERGELAIQDLQDKLKTYDDPLASVLVEFANSKSETTDQANELLYAICYSIVAYVTHKTHLENEIKRSFLSEFLNNNLIKENYTGVCCKVDDQTVGVAIPKSFLKDKSEQEIIEFAKTCPEFKDLQDKEYHIMSEKELEIYFNTAKLELVSLDKEKETEEKPEEDKECQTTTV